MLGSGTRLFAQIPNRSYNHVQVIPNRFSGIANRYLFTLCVRNILFKDDSKSVLQLQIGSHELQIGSYTLKTVYRMSAVIQQFSGVSQCIVHSILSGKTMIVAGPEYLRSVVVLYIKTLSSILPVKPNELLPVLKWHTGTITPHHLKLYKIIGTCIPERLHVQDLMSIATLNQETVRNSGTLLYKADQLSRRNFYSDMSLQTALQAILISLSMKVFLHYHLLKTTNYENLQ